MNIKINPFDESSIDEAIERLEQYAKGLDAKSKQLAEKLAFHAQMLAEYAYEGTQNDGPKDVHVTSEPTEKGYRITASGDTVLFMEFGAGITYGGGHPEAGTFGMGPGTYPNGKGNWNKPNGWYIPKEKGGGHTFGNVPSMAMYNAEQETRRQIETFAKEIFSHD